MKRDVSESGIGAILQGLRQSRSLRRGKLTREEIDRYLRAADRQLAVPAEEKREMLARLRAWAEADDGKPVFMLNLMRYYDRVRHYPGAPSDFSGTPQQSNEIYERHVSSLLFKRGGYPMVAG